MLPEVNKSIANSSNYLMFIEIHYRKVLTTHSLVIIFVRIIGHIIPDGNIVYIVYV